MIGKTIHERVSVHSICFPTASVDDLFRHWGELGARRVSFSSGQLLEHDPKAVRARLDAAGHQVETLTHVLGANALYGGPDVQAAARAGLSRAIETATVIGAGTIYMLTGGRGAMTWEEAADVFSETIAPCRSEAREAGVALAIENTIPFFADMHLANNLHDTVKLAEQAGIGVCIDYYAGWTESGMDALIERAMPICKLIQMSDYVYGDRAWPCRAVPGDGALPLRAFTAHALKAGYRGAFDLELIGPRIDAEGHQAAVARAARYMGDLLSDLGA